MTDARMRSREQERTDEEETADGCPECGGLVVQDEEHGESLCADCGLVVEEDGIDRGEFDATVDPTVATEFLVTAVSGAYTRQVAMDRSPEQLLATMTRYVETRLLAE